MSAGVPGLPPADSSLTRLGLSHGWWAALTLAVIWGLGPALPALLSGQLIGQPFTDLYPSVWGMWAFSQSDAFLPEYTLQLAAPEGMPFYYSSPLHGWFAAPLMGWLGVPATWNLGVVSARIATVLCAFGAARAFGLRPAGALVAAAAFGCSPFFHGYAVEGIVEGLDGWTLALFLWATRARRDVLAVFAFGLCLLSSWYLGAVACLLAAMLGPRAWAQAIGGLLIALPGLIAFLSFTPDLTPLSSEVRAAMGTDIGQLLPGQWTPGLAEGLNPFAKTSWVGFVLPVSALFAVRERPRWALAGVVLFVLSLGVGPWFSLPPFSAIRFPYRFHAGTLVVLGGLAGWAAQRWRFGVWLAPVIVLEGLLLSPIEPILPGSPTTLEPVYSGLKGKVMLDLPGPLAVPPGEINRSRARARWFLYQQVGHGMSTPWAPDFNNLGVATQDGLETVRALDPLSGEDLPDVLLIPDAVDWIVLHPKELRGRSSHAKRLLLQAGWEPQRAGERELWARKQGL